MLLQRVNDESQKPGSGGLLKVVLYVLSLVVAYFFGYFEHSRTHPQTPASPGPEMVSVAPAPSSPADTASAVPLPSPAAATPSAPPEAAISPSASPSDTPVRVERGIAVVASASTVPSPAPLATKGVTITEPVEIPVKDDKGKITGYINLQRGQVITPISVENDQIKIKSGKSFVFVPVSSTDMAH